MRSSKKERLDAAPITLLLFSSNDVGTVGCCAEIHGPAGTVYGNDRGRVRLYAEGGKVRGKGVCCDERRWRCLEVLDKRVRQGPLHLL